MELLSLEEIQKLQESPKISRDGIEIDLSQVDRAAKRLGVKLPVKVRIMSGQRRVGSHYLKDGVHHITVSRRQSLLEINKTIWHELQHAADCQKWLEKKEMGIIVSYRSMVTEAKAIMVEETIGVAEWLVRRV